MRTKNELIKAARNDHKRSAVNLELAESVYSSWEFEIYRREVKNLNCEPYDAVEVGKAVHRALEKSVRYRTQVRRSMVMEKENSGILGCSNTIGDCDCEMFVNFDKTK